MARFQIYGIPAVGTKLIVGEQIFAAVSVEPYQRQDGGDSFIIIWRANCADCAAEFDQTTGTAGGVPKRRCPPCRTPDLIRPVGQRGKPVEIEVRRPGANGVKA